MRAPSTRGRARRKPIPDDARARILSAAETLFVERGFDGVSVRDIAERAGCAKALVFYYHGSKEGLFASILDGYYEAHTRVLAAAGDGGGDFRQRVRAMMERYLDFMAGHHVHARLVMQEVSRGSENLPRIRQHFAELFEAMTGSLGALLPPSGPLSAKHFFLSVSGMVINYFNYGPLLEGIWHGDPLLPAVLAERREHVLWAVDALVERLVSDLEKARKKSVRTR